MIFRTCLHWVLARRAPAIDPHDVGRMRLRVVPTDLDVLGHMNNGVYLSIMDLGRLNLLVRSGIWASFKRLGYYPVVVNETISFRKSLQPWQRFELETRIVGYDEKSVFVEQRFVAGGEIFARAFIRGRFLKKSGGVVSMSELSAAAGIDTTLFPAPDWLVRWGRDVALPTTRAAAPSEWPE